MLYIWSFQMKEKALILQNAEGEGPGILADCLKRRNWGREIVSLNHGEAIPEDWREYSLLVIMGGPMNVYEEETYPFLKEETQLIKMAIKDGLPVMGFCLGAQLMAKALGARVMKGPQKEIGWYHVNLTEKGGKDGLLCSFPKEVTVFQWHGDTFELPDGAVRLFSSENYLNQAMRIGYMNYGFQFHFEITGGMITEWLRTGSEEIDSLEDKDLADKILCDVHSNRLPVLHSLAESFFDNYLRMLEYGQRIKIRNGYFVS